MNREQRRKQPKLEALGDGSLQFGGEIARKG